MDVLFYQCGKNVELVDKCQTFSFPDQYAVLSLGYLIVINRFLLEKFRKYRTALKGYCCITVPEPEICSVTGCDV